jgi:cobalt transporter subunit CbtA
MPSPATRAGPPGALELLLAAARAGLLAGLFAALAHQIGTVPLIQRAEVYERAAENAEAGTALQEAELARSPTGHAHEPAHSHAGVAAGAQQPWAPADGLERVAYTALADVATAFGFALLLVAALALRGARGGWREGLHWGLAGFAAFVLAPGLGLPPELPGTEAGPLLARQLWWSATAVLSAGGLALLFLPQRASAALAGAVLIGLPHLWGAPLADEPAALAPEALARQFASTATAVSFFFWAVLGAASGHFHAQLAGASTGPRAA